MNTNNVLYILRINVVLPLVLQQGLTHANDGKSYKGYTLNVRVSVSLSVCGRREQKRKTNSSHMQNRMEKRRLTDTSSSFSRLEIEVPRTQPYTHRHNMNVLYLLKYRSKNHTCESTSFLANFNLILAFTFRKVYFMHVAKYAYMNDCRCACICVLFSIYIYSFSHIYGPSNL